MSITKYLEFIFEREEYAKDLFGFSDELILPNEIMCHGWKIAEVIEDSKLSTLLMR